MRVWQGSPASPASLALLVLRASPLASRTSQASQASPVPLASLASRTSQASLTRVISRAPPVLWASPVLYRGGREQRTENGQVAPHCLDSWIQASTRYCKGCGDAGTARIADERLWAGSGNRGLGRLDGLLRGLRVRAHAGVYTTRSIADPDWGFASIRRHTHVHARETRNTTDARLGIRRQPPTHVCPRTQNAQHRNNHPTEYETTAAICMPGHTRDGTRTSRTSRTDQHPTTYACRCIRGIAARRCRGDTAARADSARCITTVASEP